MNQDYLKQEKFETRSAALCARELVMNWQRDNILFREIMHISARCQCSFRFVDTMILSSKEPMRYEMPVETLEDLNAGHSFNLRNNSHRKWELPLNRAQFRSHTLQILKVCCIGFGMSMTASKWVQEDEEKFSRSQELLYARRSN